MKYKTPPGYITSTDAAVALGVTYPVFATKFLKQIESFQPYNRAPHLIPLTEIERMKNEIRK
jgi:hypothetical protein